MSVWVRPFGAVLFVSLLAGSAWSENTQPESAQPLIATPDQQVPAAKVEDALPQDPIAIELRRQVAQPGFDAIATRERDRAALTEFYNSALLRAIWVRRDGLTPAAHQVISEIKRADDWGLKADDFALSREDQPGADPARSAADLAMAELRLSAAVLKYVRYARGGRMDPTQLSYSIDRQPPLREPKQVLQDIATTADPAGYLRRQHPRHPQFEKLRQAYLAMRAGASPLEAEPAADDPVSTRSMRKSKTSKQAETGSAQRVLLNMEQWRWMPENMGDMYVWINIPEFTLRLVKNGETIHSERLIVGKLENQTPIFSNAIQTIVFRPDWNVPNSIKVKELLPGLLAGEDSFSRQGLRASYRGRPANAHSFDWRMTDIRNLDVVQPPGPRNVLGVVKFLFPNKHDVYIHDTPTKALFNEETRAFSHGCMRLRNPVRLAEIILAEDKGWGTEHVAQLVKQGPPKNGVQLDRKIPVHITYFTAAADDAGKPQFWRDIYRHERLIQMGLEGKVHLIAKKKDDLGPIRPRVVARSTEGRDAETPRARQRYTEAQRSYQGGFNLFGGIFGF